MKKQKLKNLFRIVILIFGISILLQNCQQEDDNLPNTDLENKDKSISQVSIDDILNQNSLSKETFGLKSKSQATFSRSDANEPSYKLTSSKGLKYEDNGTSYYVFLMKRTDENDSYFYNLVVRQNNNKIDKFIYKYPLDKSETVTISKITNNSPQAKTKSISGGSSDPIITVDTDLGNGCFHRKAYRVTPCPCVGHLDPSICTCPIQPIWVYIGGVPVCPSPPINNPTIEEPDNNNGIDIRGGTRIIDPYGCVRNSEGLTECLAPVENPDAIIPYTPIPTIEPDFEEYSIISTLELTNSQKDWLEKLENQNFKSGIEDYLNQFIFIEQFNDAKIFAQQAIIAWILNRNTVVDFENEIIKDSTFVDTKADCVYNLLKFTNNNLFKEVMSAFTSGKAKYKLKFQIGDVPAGADGSTLYNESSGIITITFPPAINFKPSIEIASFILHEGIHAELRRIYHGNNLGTEPLSTAQYNYLVTLWEHYIGISPPSLVGNNASHTFMVHNHVLPIANAVRQFDNNSYLLENYMWFGWEGLSDIGKITVPPLLTSAQETNYISLQQVPLTDSITQSCDE